MKNSIFFLLCFFVLCSCSNEVENIQVQAPELATVRIDLGGDFISESIRPLTRSSREGYIYAVTVDKVTYDSSEAPGGSTMYTLFHRIKEGMFDDTRYLTIDLPIGSTYNFTVSVLKNESESVYSNFSSFYHPFTSNSYILANQFDKYEYDESTITYYNYVSGGSSTSTTQGDYIRGPLTVDHSHDPIPDSSYSLDNYSKLFLHDFLISTSETEAAHRIGVSKYYGEQLINLKQTNQNVVIPLLRQNFGLSLSVVPPTDGKLVILCESPKISYEIKATDVQFYNEEVFTMSSDEESETISIAFDWIRPDNRVVHLEKEIEVIRNTMKVLSVDLNNRGGSSVITIDIPTDEMDIQTENVN